MSKTIIHIGFPKTRATFLQRYLDSTENIPHFIKIEIVYKTGNIDKDATIENIEKE